MLALTEEKLEAAGVTKGARHKIILSIRKLKDRYNTLCQMEEVGVTPLRGGVAKTM